MKILSLVKPREGRSTPHGDVIPVPTVPEIFGHGNVEVQVRPAPGQGIEPLGHRIEHHERIASGQTGEGTAPRVHTVHEERGVLPVVQKSVEKIRIIFEDGLAVFREGSGVDPVLGEDGDSPLALGQDLKGPDGDGGLAGRARPVGADPAQVS